MRYGHGTPRLIRWEDLINPSNGYLDNDDIILEVKILEMYNSFSEYAEKDQFVGLESANINASMNNVVLQTMFLNYQFREKVYKTAFSINSNKYSRDLIEKLQRVFYL